jgi:hypothetical protein
METSLFERILFDQHIMLVVLQLLNLVGIAMNQWHLHRVKKILNGK